MERAPSGWRYTAIPLLDAAIVCLSFYLAFALRFEGSIPPDRLEQFRRFLPVLLLIRLPLLFLFGVHRWSFRFSGIYEAGRVIGACLTGSALLMSVFYFMQREAEDLHIGAPRAVIVIEFFLTTTLLGAFRFSPRFARGWFVGRGRGGRRSVRALIVGAGSAGELLLRDLQRSDEHAYDVVGFVDDAHAKWGSSIGGRPVLGPLSMAPEIARRRDVRELLFAIPRLPPARLREVLADCAELKLNYKVLPVSYAYLADHVRGVMLHDLSPEDLLPRSAARFDPGEMRALVEGRRILVTGAAGSIGSEICRQLCLYGPATLTLADINENDLYFLYRQLKQAHPEVAVTAEVCHVRDRGRILQLGARYRPQDVFHAAAHKHVPLMEYSPEEAIKNNVGGCRNLLAMAEESAVERFVLVSTDKAVNPTSAMGVSKRIAEALVRAQAGRAGALHTSVRFGNVLGSAGSVVPLFKLQIAAGGPVTVTHPECRRYLMTIPEAVGVVLLAGLSHYGDLCILEMGEPMKIVDLARLMITMSGAVPDRDIPIVFTGLRPGEKLEEELMTAEEAAVSRRVRDTVVAVDVAPPSAEFLEAVTRIEALAARGDRAALVAALHELIPTYKGGAPQRAGQAQSLDQPVG